MTLRKCPEVKYAPREVFEKILEYAVIPTFDLVVELPEGGGVVLARRTIAPYQNKWAMKIQNGKARTTAERIPRAAPSPYASALIVAARPEWSRWWWVISSSSTSSTA